MGKWIHRLSNIDDANLTAMCANCGEVKIRKRYIRRRNAYGYRCMVARKKERHEMKGYIHPEPDACEICGEVGELQLDHDHLTMFFRGWLCQRCNVTLGWIEGMSPDSFARMIDYIYPQVQ